MPTTTLPAALTIGEVSRRLGVAVHRIEHVVLSRNICPGVGWCWQSQTL